MSGGRRIGRLIGAIVCAYLIVVQAAVGGLASARHAGVGDRDILSVLCLNSRDDADGSTRDHDSALCCVAGCVPAVAALAFGPEPVPFRYDPRPTPRRVLAEREAPPPGAADLRLRQPRGPPAAA